MIVAKQPRSRLVSYRSAENDKRFSSGFDGSINSSLNAATDNRQQLIANVDTRIEATTVSCEESVYFGIYFFFFSLLFLRVQAIHRERGESRPCLVYLTIINIIVQYLKNLSFLCNLHIQYFLLFLLCNVREKMYNRYCPYKH